MCATSSYFHELTYCEFVSVLLTPSVGAPGANVFTLSAGNSKLVNRYVLRHIGKTIPVTDREGPQGCETSRLPHFIDSWLTDGGEVVSLTRRPLFTLQKHSWYSFLLEAESTKRPW
jgi:hypothetical protein